jgi:hypothetical protein
MPPHATKIQLPGGGTMPPSSALQFTVSEARALLSGPAISASALTVVNTRNIDKMGNTVLYNAVVQYILQSPQGTAMAVSIV